MCVCLLPVVSAVCAGHCCCGHMVDGAERFIVEVEWRPDIGKVALWGNWTDEGSPASATWKGGFTGRHFGMAVTGQTPLIKKHRPGWPPIAPPSMPIGPLAGLRAQTSPANGDGRGVGGGVLALGSTSGEKECLRRPRHPLVVDSSAMGRVEPPHSG